MHLIKQVEQVTGKNPCISGLAIIELAVIWLQNSENSEGAICLRRGQSGNAAGPNRRFHEPGHMRCRAAALPNSVRLIHNRGNLARCPDFKMSQYRLTSTDAVSYDIDVSQMIYR